MTPHVALVARLSKDSAMDGLDRHGKAVRNVTLPGDYVAFRLGVDQVGWARPDSARLLANHGCGMDQGAVILPETAALPGLARTLAEAGAFKWRGEAFDVRAVANGPVLATVDRGALPWFGIMAEGVHVNGLVRRPEGLHLWVARRAADRMMDPGKLDHLFAGGIGAGFSAAQTLIKEGGEEAGLEPSLLAGATFAGIVQYESARPEGLRRDRLHCYDLYLPEDVIPVPSDGEVAGFELWPMERVVTALRETDDFKFNVALVIVDLIERLGCKKEVLF
jgi:8-oxo-dGTP pyrophosphatase MutT (NUDIX family)